MESEAKLNSLKAEVEAVKTENKLLAAKVEALQAQNDGMQANCREMQAKLKVAELETKQAKQAMNNLIAEKITEAIGRLLNGQLTEKLNKQEADSQNKWKEFAVKLANLEAKENESRKEMELWKNNRWGIAEHVQMDDKKSYWTNVRASQPIVLADLASVPGQWVYYEVLVKNDPSVSYYSQHFYYIGWISSDFPLNSTRIGKHSGSFAINNSREFWSGGSNSNLAGNLDGFQSGDIVGSGFLVTKENKLKMFFTKNGRLYGKPIALTGQTPIYPAASFYPKNQASVEVNFGADPGKPFKFDLEANRAQLFN